MHLWTLMDLWIYLDGLEHLLLYMWYILWWMWYVLMDVWMDEIYMWWMRYMIVWIYLSWWNVKKITVLGHFAECCTRQRTPLPSAMVTALGKAGKMGARKTIFSSFAECHDHGTRQRILKKSNFAECRPEGTRQRIFFKKKFKLCRVPARGHSAKIFFLKKIKLCRVPARGHSAKNFF